MKTKPFTKTQFTSPTKDNDGTWSFQEFPAIGGDIVHGDFSSRAEARSVRSMLVKESQGSAAMAERIFAIA